MARKVRSVHISRLNFPSGLHHPLVPTAMVPSISHNETRLAIAMFLSSPDATVIEVPVVNAGRLVLDADGDGDLMDEIIPAASATTFSPPNRNGLYKRVFTAPTAPFKVNKKLSVESKQASKSLRATSSLQQQQQQFSSSFLKSLISAVPLSTSQNINSGANQVGKSDQTFRSSTTPNNPRLALSFRELISLGDTNAPSLPLTTANSSLASLQSVGSTLNLALPLDHYAQYASLQNALRAIGGGSKLEMEAHSCHFLLHTNEKVATIENHKGQGRVVCGTLPLILELLWSRDFYDRKFAECFLLSFPLFSDAGEMGSTFLERALFSLKNARTSLDRASLTLRLAHFIALWIQHRPDDFHVPSVSVGHLKRPSAAVNPVTATFTCNVMLLTFIQQHLDAPHLVSVLQNVNSHPVSILDILKLIYAFALHFSSLSRHKMELRHLVCQNCWILL